LGNGRGRGSDRGRGGRGRGSEGNIKRPLDGSGVNVQDSLVTQKKSQKQKAREEESAELRQSRGLRRGRRATLLADTDDGLGIPLLRRPEGRRALLLG
jgi:hypothetical protein